MAWQNWIEQQDSDASAATPKTVLELLELLEDAAKAGEKVRAVGSGHATSEVARPHDGGLFVHLRAMKVAPPWPYLRSGVEGPGSYLERLGAARTIRDVSAELLARERAFITLGSFDAQTIAGAVLTGTHGSGIAHHALPDYVEAIELATVIEENGQPAARLLRIERTNGITDPALFEAAQDATSDPVLIRTELRQDDALFASVLVSLGTLGIVTAVTMRVTDRYWLWEDERLLLWSQLRAEMKDPSSGKPIKRIAWYARAFPEHVDITIAAHEMPASHALAGEVVCLVRYRQKRPAGDADRAPRRKDVTPAPPWVGSILGTGIIEWINLSNRDGYLRKMYEAFDGRAGLPPQLSESSIILKTSYGDYVNATSSELAFPMESDGEGVEGTRLVDAIDELLHLAKTNETPDDHGDLEWFHTSPIGVRFVRGSRAHLAHTAGVDRTFATIECPLLVSTRQPHAVRARREAYRKHMLEGIERALTDPDGPYLGRPHWGQRFYTLDAAKVARLYPGWHAFWLAHRELNRYGVFDNDLTSLLSLRP